MGREISLLTSYGISSCKIMWWAMRLEWETMASLGSPVVPEIGKYTAGECVSTRSLKVRQFCSPWRSRSSNGRTVVSLCNSEISVRGSSMLPSIPGNLSKSTTKIFHVTLGHLLQASSLVGSVVSVVKRKGDSAKSRKWLISKSWFAGFGGVHYMN